MTTTYRIKCPRCHGNPAGDTRMSKDIQEGRCFRCFGAGTVERRKPQKRLTMEDHLAELNARLAAEYGGK